MEGESILIEAIYRPGSSCSSDYCDSPPCTSPTPDPYERISSNQLWKMLRQMEREIYPIHFPITLEDVPKEPRKRRNKRKSSPPL
jgi:hypothetical protein